MSINDFYHMKLSIAESQHELMKALMHDDLMVFKQDKYRLINMILHLISAPDKGEGLVLSLHAASVFVKAIYLIQKRKLNDNKNDIIKLTRDYDEIDDQIKAFIIKLKSFDGKRKTYDINHCYGLLTHNPVYGYCCFVGYYLQMLNSVCHINKIHEFAFYLHELLLLRMHVHRDVSKNTLEYLARVARKFIAAPPEDNYHYSGDPSFITGVNRKQFFRDLTIARNKESGRLLYSQVDETFVRRLLNRSKHIVKGTRISPNQRFFGRVLRLKGINGEELQERSHQVTGGTPSIIDPNSTFNPKTNRFGEYDFTVKQFVLSEDELGEALENGECEDDHVATEIYIYPSNFFDLKTWPNVKNARTIAEHVTFSKSSNLYDLNVYTPMQIRKIFDALDSLESEQIHNSSEHIYDHKIRLIIYLMLFTGMTRSNIQKITGAPEDLSLLSDIELFNLEVNAPIIILPDESALLHYYTTARWLDATTDPNYIRTNNPYKLILPEFISHLIPSSLRHETSYFTINDLRATNKFLMKISKDFRLSFLTNSFRAYFSGAGMPDLSLRIIAGDIPFYLRSQAFYNTLDWNHLNNQWCTMCLAFKSSIDDGFNSEAILELMTYRFEHPSAIFSNNQSVSYVGANRTPCDQALIDHFSYLYDLFPHDNMYLMMNIEPKKWNAYIAYLLGLFAICTGKRPVKYGLIDVRDIFHSPFCHVIADKRSAKYKESRTIFLCPTLQKSLLAYHQLFKNGWAEQMVGKGYKLSDRPASITMIDHENSCLIPYSSKMMDELFGDAPQFITGMANAHRHYLLSRLARVGVDQSWIDFISGHRHGGTEPEYNTSLLNWRHTATKISEIIEINVVDHLQLKATFDA